MYIPIIDKYTKEELENVVKNSSSMREVIKKLGYATVGGNNNKTVKERIERYNIDISHFTKTKGIERNPDNVFVENSTASQKTLREWYIKGKYTEYKCSICGQDPIWQGKELTLILDHINGTNNDDRLENLRWVCPNCNQQLDTTGGKQSHKNKDKIEKKYYCIECGAELKSKDATLCPICAGKARRVVDRPTRNELKTLIRTKSFVQIGKEFGVSDNSIRKWCIAENLPSTKKEIQKYSDKEWELI